VKLRLETKSVEPDGAFSDLLHEDGSLICYCIEKTFDDGLPKIPAGEHRCTKTFFNRGGYHTFEIHVEGHTRLLFHSANVESQLDGCIAVGLQMGVLDGHKAVLQSKAAFQIFWMMVHDLEEFVLEVVGR